VAHEALADAAQHGAHTVWVQATRSAASVPLGTFAGVIPEGVRSADLFELLQGGIGALSELAGSRPLVLGIDDAQMLDHTSAALVLQLASTGAGFPISTIRSGEQCPDAIVSLWKDAGAERLELAALTEQETSQLVEGFLGGPVEEGLRRWIWETSAGNALYVRELVLGALTGGALLQVSGLWRMQTRPAISATLSELVTARLTGLDAAERRALELVALGEPLPLSELTALAGSDPLAGLETRSLIRIDGRPPGAEVRLVHPLYGEVISDSLPYLRAREARIALATSFRSRERPTPRDSLRIARWLLDAGEKVPTEILLDAAREANLSGDPALGAQLSRRAVDAGAGIKATLLLARACAIQKRFAEAESVLAPVEGLIDSQDAALEYLEQRAVTVLYWGLRRPDDAQVLLARAREWWPERAWLRRLDPLRLHLASLIEGFPAAAAVSEEILRDDSLEEPVRRQMEPVHAVNLFFAGRVREAYELVRRIRPAIPLTNQSEDLALIALSAISIESGQDFPLLEREMAQVLTASVRAGDHAAAGVGAMTLGGLAFLAGRYLDATRWLGEAELQFEHQDAFSSLVVVRATQVGVARFRGLPDDTARALERCEEALRGQDPLPNLVPYLVRARAWAADLAGDRPTAQRMLLETAEGIAAMPIYAAQLHYEAMRVGASAGALAPVLAALRDRCDARLVAAYARHAQALAANDGAALLEAADEFEGIGTLRYAAEAAADAAEAFANAARRDSAWRAAARCAELCPSGQGGIPPLIKAIDGAAIELTPRESQLAELAARGLSNAEIAERLVLSVRTVESHLYRAMQKLGVSDRRDLRPTGGPLI
jgi:DNA-binding CsgD family transcriptional regulator